MDKKECLIGAHTSIAGGVYNALEEGKKIGATTIQCFTANQRQWQTKSIPKEAIVQWHEVLKATGLSHIMSHDSYLINLGAPDEEVLVKSRKAFDQEISRCLDLGITYLNFHPGSALKESKEQCLNRIVESLLQTKHFFDKGTLRLLLETTAGQGSTVGATFEELSYIIELVKDHIPIGVCIDTCHIFVAGYDIRTKEAQKETFDLFDTVIGLEHLYAFHLNDSVKGLGSRVDRHKPLGEGTIGIDAFQYLMQDPRFAKIPKYLETPGGDELWEKEIALLKKFYYQ